MAEEVTSMVKAFFCGYKLPRYVTHTSLVLFPKKKLPRIFSYLRPISLTCFVDKVISRVIYDRLVIVLPKIISHNQDGFIKGRSIIENFLLAQEIIRI